MVDRAMRMQKKRPYYKTNTVLLELLRTVRWVIKLSIVYKYATARRGFDGMRSLCTILKWNPPLRFK